MKTWLYCVALVWVSCENRGTNEKLSETESDFDAKIAWADSIFIKRDSVRAFVKLQGSPTIIEVIDFNNWPDSIEVIYNVCYYNDKVVLYKEIPQIEFDEYSIYYSYYLESEAIFGIDLEARYFNESCSESAIIENTQYAYEDDRFIQQKYSLVDAGGKLMDSTSCSFGKIRGPNKYKTLTETPIASLIQSK